MSYGEIFFFFFFHYRLDCCLMEIFAPMVLVVSLWRVSALMDLVVVLWKIFLNSIES